MSDPKSRWSAQRYLRFLAVLGAAVGALVAIGLALSVGSGGGSVRAMLAALAATGLASALSGIPLARVGGTPQAALNRALLAMLIRLGLVAVLAAVCLLSLKVAQTPFLVWLVIGYLALLAVDTLFTVRASRSL